MKLVAVSCLLGVCLWSQSGFADDENTPIIEMDEFVVWQEARTRAGEVMPDQQVKSWLWGGDGDLLLVPRAVTPVNPETLRMLDIRDFNDLGRVGAGTQRANYFGMAGSAFLRGARAGVYFNGMLRAYQRNEMPTSFGSAEGLDLIKGPSPAHLSPTLVGGFVNQRPKEPYYDKKRASVEVAVGQWNEYRYQVDGGGPQMVGDLPAAWRVSFTGQRADSYYQGVSNDYDSLYASWRIKLKPTLELFTGAEFFRYRSSENPGINRPTQRYIDEGRYVLGEPVDLTAPEWGGTVVRPLIEFPLSNVVNPSLHSLSVPGALVRQQVPESLRALLIDLNDPQQVAALYSLRPDAQIPGFLYQSPEQLASLKQRAANNLALLSPQTTDSYVYTPAFFAAGGEALTVPLSGDRVLADPRDRADAHNGIFFLDFHGRGLEGRNWTNQLFVEGMETDKYSTYGYASRTSQLIAENRFQLDGLLDHEDRAISVGLSLRASYGKMRQDFFAEPFSRRDLSQSFISENSRVLAGDDVAADGLNLWSPAFGANRRSQLYQMAVFALGHQQWGPVRLDASVRAEQAWYYFGVPREVERAGETYRATYSGNGNERWLNATFSPVWTIHPNVALYGALQKGKGLAPADGGTIMGEGSFTDTELVEAGLKMRSTERTFWSTIAVYQWEQSTFSARDAYSQPLRGRGVELEMTWEVTERFTLMGAFNAQRVRLLTNVIGFGALPFDEEDWALRGGILNAAGDRSVPNNPDMVYAGSPEFSAHVYGVYADPSGWSVSTGPYWQDGYWHDFGRNMRIPSNITWFSEWAFQRGAWTLRLRLDNVFNSAGWATQEPIFAANTLITTATPRRWMVTLRYDY